MRTLKTMFLVMFLLLSSTLERVYVSIDGGSSFVKLFDLPLLVSDHGVAFVHPVNKCVYFNRPAFRLIGICK